MFELEAIQEERDMLEELLTDINNNAAGRATEMHKIQQRYTEYETDFFS